MPLGSIVDATCPQCAASSATVIRHRARRRAAVHVRYEMSPSRANRRGHQQPAEELAADVALDRTSPPASPSASITTPAGSRSALAMRLHAELRRASSRSSMGRSRIRATPSSRKRPWPRLTNRGQESHGRAGIATKRSARVAGITQSSGLRAIADADSSASPVADVEAKLPQGSRP